MRLLRIILPAAPDQNFPRPSTYYWVREPRFGYCLSMLGHAGGAWVRCPAAATPLSDVEAIAKILVIGEVWYSDRVLVAAVSCARAILGSIRHT